MISLQASRRAPKPPARKMPVDPLEEPVFAGEIQPAPKFSLRARLVLSLFSELHAVSCQDEMRWMENWGRYGKYRRSSCAYFLAATRLVRIGETDIFWKTLRHGNPDSAARDLKWRFEEAGKEDPLSISAGHFNAGFLMQKGVHTYLAPNKDMLAKMRGWVLEKLRYEAHAAISRYHFSPDMLEALQKISSS